MHIFTYIYIYNIHTYTCIYIIFCNYVLLTTLQEENLGTGILFLHRSTTDHKPFFTDYVLSKNLSPILENSSMYNGLNLTSLCFLFFPRFDLI